MPRHYALKKKFSNKTHQTFLYIARITGRVAAPTARDAKQLIFDHVAKFAKTIPGVELLQVTNGLGPRRKGNK